MSFTVLVIPEDPVLNGHILKPLAKAVIADAGRPAAKVAVGWRGQGSDDRPLPGKPAPPVPTLPGTPPSPLSNRRPPLLDAGFARLMEVS